MKRDERKRINAIEKIAKSEHITHCYILKGGYWYRENSCGYTEYRSEAGIYSKEEAVEICRSCSIEVPVPIHIPEHNRMITHEISLLSKRIINETIKSTTGSGR